MIDDCLEIDAVAQSVPYATKERPSLVPDVNDALVTTVFKRKLPSMIANAAKTCRLSTDDSGARFSGDCQRDSGELVPASLDASGCVNSTGIENQNGTLRCVGQQVPKQKGDYLRSCGNIDWNGSTLHAACGTMESLTHPTLNDAGTCRPESTVSYERSGVGSFARGALVCDAPR